MDKTFPEPARRTVIQPITIRYDLPGATTTNLVGTEKLEKAVEFRVSMDEQDFIPEGPIGIETSTDTRSIPAERPFPTTGRMVLLNFRDSPLTQALSFYSHCKGVTVTAAPGLDHTITCVSSSRLSGEEAIRFIDAVLTEQGINLVEQPDGALRAEKKN